jgi:hypothetical protein
MAAVKTIEERESVMERENVRAKMCLVCAITSRMGFNTPLCEEQFHESSRPTRNVAHVNF